MSTKQKKKLCWNCEGRVSFEEENCPYCSVYLGPAIEKDGKQNVLAPPYQIIEEEEDLDALESPYQIEGDSAAEEVPELDEAKNDMRQVVLPLGMLSAGSLFFLFGLMLLIFSDHGTLTLSWSADYWYLYVLLALPALFFGWVSLGRSDLQGE
ncbi:putative uncharacterized protein [Waddlia chondrophila 2032/99]|uniref:Uncharacterized protein n=2 Tax=Waddlia chondrophila TaxID=71667 RepID=D6YTL8_WADCW|nr:hypothetical protein [Waddlia chondrophila]ADI37479.1 conserved hypothetical protein [Waddlia chondrophila WSU 86-1044]CCB90798.1 putative uncharacterized protein [Waddlia chondrophila 2032/99]